MARLIRSLSLIETDLQILINKKQNDQQLRLGEAI